MTEAAGGAGTATILFTDLVGSTELRTRLGDGAADELRRHHDQLVTQAVEEHRGTIVKLLGDGALASFGAAADAVGAATDVQRAIDRANRRVDDTRRLQLRVGCSAGDVAWEDGDCHGTPVVTAARLCDRAEGGQILVDDLVRGLARGRAEHAFRLVGELELKGLGEPVVAYEVPWEPLGTDRAPLPAPLLPVGNELPFAGRDAERDALRTQWKSAQADGRAVALVSGEPGMGKTRLTAELARSAHAEGAWVFAGRCDENIAAPYAPWLEILRHVVAHAPVELLAAHVERHGGELRRLVPEITRRVDSVPEPRSLDAETEQLALYDAVVDLLDTLAADAPVLLVVDDAHWADASTLGLLRHAIRTLPPSSALLVVVTYRDTDVDRSHPLSSMIGDLRREPRVDGYALRGIDEEGLRSLLTAAGGAELDDMGRQFASTLERETEGNPFFVGEVLRHLIETNVIVQEDGRWRGAVSSIDEVGIPEGVRDVVGRRLSRLDDDANTTLRTAAVVGREFSIEVVAEVMERRDDDVLRDVEAAIDASLVNEVMGTPGRMSFSHALVQSTLLDELSTTRRVRLHAAIGEALERRGASAAELAHHFAEGATVGVADKALQYARRAAEEAVERLAYEEQVAFCTLALEAIDALGPGDDADRARAEVLIERAVTRHQLRDQDGGRADALAAAEIGRRIAAPNLIAGAGVGYMGGQGHWAQPSDPVAVGLMREGLEHSAPMQERERAVTLAYLAEALVLVPGDEALTVAEEAELLARSCGDDEALTIALNAQGWALRSRGRSADVCRVCEASIEAAERTGRLDWQWGSRFVLAEGLLELGDVERATAEMAAAYAVPSAIQGWGPVALAVTLALAEARFEGIDELIEEAAALGAPLGDTNETIRAGHHSVAALYRGRVDDALLWAEANRQTLMGLATGFHPYALAEVGEVAAAVAAHAEWARDVRPHAPQVLRHWMLHYEAVVALRCDARDLAQRLADELEPFRGTFIGGSTLMFGATEGTMALVAIVDQRFDEAIPLAEHAIAEADRRGWRTLSTEYRIALARAFLGRGASGDADRAAATLRDAIETADACGLVLMAEEARDLLA